MMKLSITQLKLRVQGQKKSKENPEIIAENKKKYEEQKAANEVKVIEETDGDFEVTKFQ